MKAENKNKKITFLSINKDLSLFKIKKNIIQEKTKNSVTAIPAIKDKGIIKSNAVKLWVLKYFIEKLHLIYFEIVFLFEFYFFFISLTIFL